MEFYDRLKSLCQKNNISLAFLASEIGLSNSASTYWKKGSIPKTDTVKKIADYFGVSVDYILYGMTEEDVAFEALETGLAMYGYSVSPDDSAPTWCYVYPSGWEEEAGFNPKIDGKHLPISFIEEKLRSAIAEGERFRKQYVQKCLKNSIDTADEMQIGALWESGDL